MTYSREKQIGNLAQDCLEEDDGDLKICREYMDKATGYHFNVMTCEGCKGFFRRTVNSNIQYNPRFQNSCVITKNSWRYCQACRLNKCLEIGMNKEIVRATERHSIPRDKSHGVTGGEAALTGRVKPYPITISSENNCKLQGNFCMLPHIADLATYMILGTINFAKAIPFFRDLSVEDQISLLKGATFEICQIRCNTLFNLDTGNWDCGNLKYSMEGAIQSGFQQLLLEPLLNFHSTLRSLKLTAEEYVLMQGISLFSPDRADTLNNKAIGLIQEKVAMTLKAIVDAKKPKADKFLFPKIMSILTEVRTLSAENNRQVLEIQNIQPDVTPLMLEMFGDSG